uniref:Uncharacterized protein n=1 Tax=Rhizophora mucronata TaxID=61149 RepID=A0A2P2LAH7_RHIMU
MPLCAFVTELSGYEKLLSHPQVQMHFVYLLTNF